ncbi:hypothetical protein [Janibacter hoylei]|uniref:hypothetical protein n=1 Tax=Janibacter hoylei TaxID=364298 RepID=UPI0021A92538|nr:hypothetical protein [Janibacter hoylei]MCT1617985.1 hypothetical protein [Janibacter hoylei]MCT2292048.1 hypothetical protein [Janibacter hoylei]
MSPRSAAPITDDVIAAIAKFFHGGAGPSHSEISRVLTGTGYSDDYTYDPDVHGPNKEKRVLRGLAVLTRQVGYAVCG